MKTKKKKTPAKKSKPAPECWYCGSTGHTESGCPAKPSSKKSPAPAVKAPVKCWADWYSGEIPILNVSASNAESWLEPLRGVTTVPSILFDATPAAREQRIELMARALISSAFAHKEYAKAMIKAKGHQWNLAYGNATAAHDAIFNGEGK